MKIAPLIDIREPLLQEMCKKLMTEEGKEKYFKNQYTIDPEQPVHV